MNFAFCLLPSTVCLRNLPFIEPHLQPVLPQTLRQRAHDRLVLVAVAEEDIVLEIVRHEMCALYQEGLFSSCRPSLANSLRSRNTRSEERRVGGDERWPRC